LSGFCKLTTNYTKRRDATVETVLGILLDLMAKVEIKIVSYSKKIAVHALLTGRLSLESQQQVKIRITCQEHENLDTLVDQAKGFVRIVGHQEGSLWLRDSFVGTEG
jgi:hypothetical protein